MRIYFGNTLNKKKCDEIFTFYVFNRNSYFESTKHKSRVDKWHGACIYIGSQRTVIVLLQAMKNFRYMNKKFKPRNNGTRYPFGNDRKESRGSIPLRVPITDTYLIFINVDVVS